jgi:predicted RNA binding protein YcfA (HicA-like mRNA interferase family)
VKLPRQVSGEELARLLHPYGYQITRQTGSHLRLTSKFKGSEHHVTIPAHKELRVGTLSAVLTEVASYLETERKELIGKLFG